MKLQIRFIIFVSIFLVLCGCQQNNHQTGAEITSTPTSTTTKIAVEESIQAASPTPTPVLNSFEPQFTEVLPSRYQLTYLTSRYEASGIFGMEAGCFETGSPCFGDPEALLWIPSGGARPPIGDYGWSPDGQEVVFEATGENRKSDIFVTNIQDVNVKNLTKSPYNEGNPVWLSTEPSIVYLANLYGNIKIFKYNLMDDVISGAFNDSLSIHSTDFSFSPDNEKILYTVSGDDGYYHLFLTDLINSTTSQLTDDNANYHLPIFSSDGQYIAYLRSSYYDSNGGDAIIIESLTNKNDVTTIENLEVDPSHISWSPDNNWITYSGALKYTSHIYIIDVLHGTVKKITSGSYDEYYPQWRIMKPSSENP